MMANSEFCAIWRPGQILSVTIAIEEQSQASASQVDIPATEAEGSELDVSNVWIDLAILQEPFRVKTLWLWPFFGIV